MSDVIINKIQSIQRCIGRAREEYTLAGPAFATNYSRQDAAILNVIRACEQAIDLANHIIKLYKMGIPTSNAETFELLTAGIVIQIGLEQKLKHMVGFRNTVVHHYQRLDIAIVESVIKSDLDDLVAFCDCVAQFAAA